MANRDREDPRLLGAIEAAIDELVGDEARHLLELGSELGVDPAHELLAAVRRDVVLADACVHRLSFDRAFSRQRCSRLRRYRRAPAIDTATAYGSPKKKTRERRIGHGWGVAEGAEASKVAVLREGSGPGVLLVHGGASPATTWAGADRLRDRWTLL